MSTLKIFKEDFYDRLGGLSIFRGRRVLDLGCREGDDTLAIAQYAREVVGLDRELHTKWNQSARKNVEFVVGRAEKLPFKDGEFDGLFVKDVLHHVGSVEESLKEIKRVTSKKAKIIIVEANRYNPLFYVHMTKLGGHEHFPQSKFKELVLKYFPSAKFLHFESHFVPHINSSIFNLLVGLERILDRVRVFRQVLSYNAAVINSDIKVSKNQRQQKSNWFLALIVFLVFLSAGKILQFYFYYDDFFLFYALQFPGDVNSIFATPEITGYRFLQPFFTPQFALFGYNPQGYFVISFVLWLLVNLLFYWFARLAYLTKKAAMFAAVIMASGYVGLESLIWNVGAGQNASAFLIASLLTLISTLLYLRFGKARYLILTTVSFSVAVYLFQFRSFLLFAWLPLLVLVQKWRSTRQAKNFYLFMVLLLAFGIVLFRESFSYSNQGSITHLQIDYLDFAKIFLRNTANFLFPSELFSYLSELRNIQLNAVELGGGGLAMLIFVSAPFIAFRRKSPSARALLFFSVASLASLAILQLAVGLIGNPPDVWLSKHRFYVVALPFLAGFLGGAFSLLNGWKATPIFLVAIWVASHIVLSNNVIEERWDNPIRHIEYFYKTIKEKLPTLDKDSVLLITQGEPTPVGIFITGNFVHGHTGIAGFYGRRVNDFLLARSPIDAAELLREKGLSADDLFAFHYRRMELVNIIDETRELLRSGKKVLLGQNLAGSSVEFADLSLPLGAPLFLNIGMQVNPNFSVQENGKVEIFDTQKYFSLLIKQKQLRRQMKAVTENAESGEEHEIDNIIDGDYATTWIPKDWEQGGVGVLVDLGSIKRINRILWSSSRTASWLVRLPSEYSVEISKEGHSFTQLKSVTDAPILKTGDFFLEEFAEQDVRYIRIVIKKTRGSLTPAIDDIEVFDSSDGNINFTDYFAVGKDPARYFPNREIARRYLDEVLEGIIPVVIDWRVDKNTDYPVGNFYRLDIGIGGSKSYRVLLPITGQLLKSIRIRPENFPARIAIESLSLEYPRLEEFGK